MLSMVIQHVARIISQCLREGVGGGVAVLACLDKLRQRGQITPGVGGWGMVWMMLQVQSQSDWAERHDGLMLSYRKDSSIFSSRNKLYNDTNINIREWACSRPSKRQRAWGEYFTENKWMTWGVLVVGCQLLSLENMSINSDSLGKHKPSRTQICVSANDRPRSRTAWWLGKDTSLSSLSHVPSPQEEVQGHPLS